MSNDFLVLEWNDVEDILDSRELDTFYGLIGKVTLDKSDKDYYVIDKSDPVAYRIPEVMMGKKPQISKEEVLKALEELKQLSGKDKALVEAEAIEILLKYINDKDIEEAFDAL